MQIHKRENKFFARRVAKPQKKKFVNPKTVSIIANGKIRTKSGAGNPLKGTAGKKLICHCCSR
jgi:hypothetical protein